jgi:LmbE family N-acetylglucosaminyl deacetylase
MTKPNIVCIFAHPDDEAFGPSGIIAKWSKQNNVYLICVTDGSNPNSGIQKLDLVRRKELNTSAKILGVKKVFYLNYVDGNLSNNIYHKVANDVEKILLKLKPEALLTYDQKGISGHIDHIFTAMVATYLYYKLGFIKKIYYSVMLKMKEYSIDDYFIYIPDGYSKDEVDLIEDVEEVWQKKISAVKAHKSQKEDGDYILTMMENSPKEELFLIKEKAVTNN